jgi:hypothetical protein
MFSQVLTNNYILFSNVFTTLFSADLPSKKAAEVPHFHAFFFYRLPELMHVGYNFVTFSAHVFGNMPRVTQDAYDINKHNHQRYRNEHNRDSGNKKENIGVDKGFHVICRIQSKV